MEKIRKGTHVSLDNVASRPHYPHDRLHEYWLNHMAAVRRLRRHRKAWEQQSCSRGIRVCQDCIHTDECRADRSRTALAQVALHQQGQLLLRANRCHSFPTLAVWDLSRKFYHDANQYYHNKFLTWLLPLVAEFDPIALLNCDLV